MRSEGAGSKSALHSLVKGSSLLAGTALAVDSPQGNSTFSRRGALNHQTSFGGRRSSVLPAVSSIGQSLSGYTAALEAQAAIKRRKLTQVGHAVTLRLGWRTNQTSTREIVDQSKTLCGRYIRTRLRSCAVAGKKLGLQRLKSVTNVASPSSSVISAVGIIIRELSLELERKFPKTFHSVTANVGLQSLPNESVVQNLFNSVAREVLRSELNWGRVVALFAISGALAVDCVRLGKPEFILGLVESVGNVVDRNLAVWIAGQGGWVALHNYSQEGSLYRNQQLFVLTAIVFLFVALIAYFVS